MVMVVVVAFDSIALGNICLFSGPITKLPRWLESLKGLLGTYENVGLRGECGSGTPSLGGGSVFLSLFPIFIASCFNSKRANAKRMDITVINNAFVVAYLG